MQELAVGNIRYDKMLLVVHHDDESDFVMVSLFNKNVEGLKGPVEFPANKLWAQAVRGLQAIEEKLVDMNREGKIELAL